MSETVIKLENLSKKYGSFIALDTVSFSVRKGEIIGLVGPNGAGKTTLLKLIARLIRPNSGSVFIKNIDCELQNIHKNSKNLIEMGFLIDIPHFYNTTPYCLLRHIANIRNYPRNKIKLRIDHLLKTFDLYEWKYKKLKTFSKGMIQKLGFMVAIIHDPELFILDEPQTGLDTNARIKIRDYLKSLQNEGKTILLSSHLLTELREVCDKIALINQGVLIGFDTIDNLERDFKTKELICEIGNPIPIERVNNLIIKMIRQLEPFLEAKVDHSNFEGSITYNHQKNFFTICYDGKQTSRSEILNILSTEFESDLTISSFYEPKISQLESLYNQMIKENNKKLK
ncbi:Vitamin B12 import ATP-binding protein BtuD [subsurface metagenome]|jgi:ABC-2 type transport system ATP-binding protein